ncbi:aminoglycoside phosphotransferase family protein [Bacillus cereus group sp. TH43LC]|uniref:aminoglycoside phosphotransferase family protein n=1 Tax=Bacillus cereus group TaxID=86661 RepID=UPI000BEE61E0|nr:MULTISPECIES: aminoglycoside phosphotransferase family protein [Bacillus cereus group]PEF59439.1 aminoglycoside phosphotransferase [Bacillus cereus]MBE7141664.1 aminoglycoside phosphotransferase family protein [Bacillus paranthracis]MCR6463671.1 aminoglycoside phosphotransferase family protein [Bacillus paranthracis]MCR9021407.1 aminoglycoside phosphotransferase family protein [Bacillus paranthracis]MDA1500323.1 aminoglycoside phosphotransferase family protein [Bacillus cereus group sp. TH4
MDISTIAAQLVKEKVISHYPTSVKVLNGGTASTVYLLDEKYVVKLNEAEVIREEAIFLSFYERNTLFANLLYKEPLHTYIVYSFLEGSTSCGRGQKRITLSTLVKEVINKYEIVSRIDGWGWKESPVQSWSAFLTKNVVEAHKNVRPYISEEEYRKVLKLANRDAGINQPFLLHGDLGFHNFIFQGNELHGVIDPLPVLGDPIYDLIYAFCSTPEDVTKETIDYAMKQCVFHKKERDLYEEIVIGLYLRIDTCLRHHPKDLEDYLVAWRYWMDEVEVTL